MPGEPSPDHTLRNCNTCRHRLPASPASAAAGYPDSDYCFKQPDSMGSICRLPALNVCSNWVAKDLAPKEDDPKDDATEDVEEEDDGSQSFLVLYTGEVHTKDLGDFEHPFIPLTLYERLGRKEGGAVITMASRVVEVSKAMKEAWESASAHFRSLFPNDPNFKLLDEWDTIAILEAVVESPDFVELPSGMATIDDKAEEDDPDDQESPTRSGGPGGFD